MSRVYWRRAGKVTGKTLRGAGRVEPTPNYWNTKLSEPVVDKRRPGPGFEIAFVEGPDGVRIELMQPMG